MAFYMALMLGCAVKADMGKAIMMHGCVLCCDVFLSYAVPCFEFGMQGRVLGESEVFQSVRCSEALSNMLFLFYVCN